MKIDKEYTLLYFSGVKHEKWAKGEVGCIISRRYNYEAIYNWKAISKQILKVQIKDINKNKHLKFITWIKRMRYSEKK